MIKIPSKIEIKESPGRGLGAFASEKIFKGEIFETAPSIELDASVDSNVLFNYRYFYPREGKNRVFVLVLGYGSLYNHNNKNNADWRDNESMIFEFFATEDIEIGEEICINYGGDAYFNLRPLNWL